MGSGRTFRPRQGHMVGHDHPAEHDRVDQNDETEGAEDAEQDAGGDREDLVGHQEADREDDEEDGGHVPDGGRAGIDPRRTGEIHAAGGAGLAQPEPGSQQAPLAAVGAMAEEATGDDLAAAHGRHAFFFHATSVTRSPAGSRTGLRPGRGWDSKSVPHSVNPSVY